jgi:quercetin dioxygenase-like cupin family protein
MRKLLAAIATAAIAAGFVRPAAAGEPHPHTMLNPSDLKWADVPSLPPGASAALIEGPLSEPVPFTIRLRFPANYRIPPHWHPAVERVTVITGTFNMGTGEKFDRSATMPLRAGSIAIMPAKTPHFAWTESDTIVQLHGVGPWAVHYVDAADDPRKK